MHESTHGGSGQLRFSLTADQPVNPDTGEDAQVADARLEAEPAGPPP